MDMETSPMYGDVGDAGYTYGSYGSYGSIRDWIVWRDERDDGVRSLQRHIEHRSTISVDGSVSPLTASILTVSTGNAWCRSAAELRVNMDLIMEIDSDCVLKWITRFEVGSSTRGDSTDDQ
jgi:hypothetical protein